MAVTLSKRKSTSTSKAAKDYVVPERRYSYCCLGGILCKVMYRLPVAIFLLFLLFLWSASTTIISGKIVHVCVSSRKLNLYCLSAGAQSQPSFELPEVPNFQNVSGVGEGSSNEVPNAVPESRLSVLKRFPFPESTVRVLKRFFGSSSNMVDEVPKSPVPVLKKSGGNAVPESPVPVLKKFVGNPIPETPVPVLKKLTGNPVPGSPVPVLKKLTGNPVPESPVPVFKELSRTPPSIEVVNAVPESPIPVLKQFSGNPVLESPVPVFKELSRTPPSIEVVNAVPESPVPVLKQFSGNPVLESPVPVLKELSETPPSLEVANAVKESQVQEVKKFSGIASIDRNSSRPGSVPVQEHNEPEKESEEDPQKAVKEQLEVQRSWIALPQHYGGENMKCGGRGIYVYDLPSKFNKDLTAQCDDIVPWASYCKYFENDAMGEPIPKLGERWFWTHQYSLEPIFHSRILKYPCRVYNENDAKLFYVPYYGGLDILRWHFKNVSNQVKDSLSLELIQWLEQRKPWARNSGKDHVFVLGKISWDFRRKPDSVWGTNFLELPQMQNPAKLLIERQPWHVNDIGIPHPTSFHPNSDSDIIAWQQKIIQSYRRNLVGFAGAARPEAPSNIRSVLIRQCTEAGQGRCRFLDCRDNGCSRPETVIEMFMESEFCLQPQGDSPTRKSLFDSLLSGCIPVLFDPFTAYYQYAWHLPKEPEKYSVFVNQTEVQNSSANVIERLRKVSKQERDDMRSYIVYELLPGLVYGSSDARFGKFRDAFSVVVDNLLERASRI